MKNVIKIGIIGLTIAAIGFAVKEEIEFNREIKKFNEYTNRMNEIKEKMAAIGL